MRKEGKMVEARRQKRFMFLSRTPMPKLRKRTRPFRLKSSVLAAIRGCYGMMWLLAEKMECATNTMYTQLHRPGWEFVLEAFQEEKWRAKGIPVRQLLFLAENAVSEAVREQASKDADTILNPQHRQSSHKVTVEGGERPIRVQHAVFNVVEYLKRYPVETRMLALEQWEQKEKEMGINNNE